MLDPLVIGIIAALITGGLSLVGTILLAIFGIKNAQISASDKIAIGSGELLDEYRTERTANKAAIDEMRAELVEINQWKQEVTEFIVPFIEGSKANERQLIAANLTPVYKLPPLPPWLHAD